MPASLIDGTAIADRITEEIRAAAERLRRERGVNPGLAFILVGEDPSSQVYVRSKERACAALGFHSVTRRCAADTRRTEILRLIESFNADPAIHGILVQLPLPNPKDESAVIEAIDPRKDVDGFHPVNVGRLVLGRPCLRPCTPAGVQELLLRSGHDPAGKHVVVLGRSNIVGKPVMNILMQKRAGANAAVTIAHTGTRNPERFLRDADIVVAAIGRPGFVRGEMLKPGSVVIDVGINRVEDPGAKKGYRLVGDVDFPSASAVASAITPVPGGVGPMTIAMLMANTLQAATEPDAYET